MGNYTGKYHIYGLVQGVGFRPFVAGLAESAGLNGYVRNDGGIVTVRLSGDEESVDGVIRRLSSLKGDDAECPGAFVERVEELAAAMDFDTGVSDGGFRIIESTSGDDELRMLPPDIATCPSCVEELFDPVNRRYRHPFISCTACGPRYTIMSAVPYDRERTTMSPFPMCGKCGDDYFGKPTDRGVRPAGYPVRRFAQTICCPDCGPKLTARDVFGNERYGDAAFDLAVEYLRAGKIVAVKDVGGYHLCFDAFCTEAAVRLREWKHREHKPFAVMFGDMDEIRRVAAVSETEEGLLTSAVAPIVLLRIKEDISESFGDDGFLEEVLGGSNRIGAFLPSNPLQHLLLREMSPLVMTSGNRGGEPIITRDEDMVSLMETGVPDLVLYNDREILYGLDDSIYQVTEVDDGGSGEELVQIFRRARGLVPAPVWVNRELTCDSFAAGGDLKSVFALGRKNAIYMSGHFGDLDEVRCVRARAESISHMEELLGIRPKSYICDRHPLYHSVTDTRKRCEAAGGDEPVYIQHHFAHTLSVIAEHGLHGQVLGVTFDGTGYGEDGTVWGGEFLLCDADEPGFRRVGHLKSVPLIGGDEAAKDPDKTAFCFLYNESKESAFDLNLPEAEGRLLSQAVDSGVNAVPNSSMGRLFDAAAAILDICHKNTYEGECPIKLMYAAERFCGDDAGVSGFDINKSDGGYIADAGRLLRELYERRSTEPKEKLAYTFHKAVAEMTADMCEMIMEECEPGYGSQPVQIALSGGTFQNSLLLKLLIPKLKNLGYNVYINSQVPSGDGGLALGQMYCLTGVPANQETVHLPKVH